MAAQQFSPQQMKTYHEKVIAEFRANGGKVGGTFAGAPTHPDWYHTLVANPNVVVETGTETFSARARVSEGSERQRLFIGLKGVIPMLEETQAKTTRELPVIVLERTG